MKEKTAKKLWDFWKDAIPGVAFFIIYMLYFHRLETIPHSMGDIWMIHLKIDDCIPFMEIFIIPYLLWFGFVFLTLAWLYLYDKGEYKRSCLFMFTGMSIFLMISTVIPNGLSLRPAVFPRDNMLTDAVRALYLTDTSTNVFPSIHVYNSIACALAAVYSKSMDKHPVLRTSWVIMATLIILST
ncbi:MAG: serine/threonine protein phosphatase, partial [Lachnospiraceae bacterium]|nr:serine/threonine protein phosphatase [Lachnospiraceae bacterium]